MPDNFIAMTEEEWFKTYKPIPNHIDKGASFNDGEQGYMFETYGKELDFVRAADIDYIWTYGDGDDDGTYVWNGYSIVNRIGYFITEIPCPANTTVQVLISEPDLTCDFCGDTINDELTHDKECEGINI
jgi:hypothetical protein